MDPAVLQELGRRYPHLSAIATAASHDEDTVVGGGCDDQFEFSLDLLLDGFERLRQREQMSTNQRRRQENP